MTAKDTLCFADSDFGVGGEPTIDGFIDHDFMASGEAGESGYINGSRLTYAGGAIAPVFFQGVRAPSTDRITFAFLCRLDTHFDDNDVIMIALRSQHSDTARTNERMIIIYPNNDGAGASGGGGTGSNDIRTNRNYRDIYFYRGNTGTGNPWIPINAPSEVVVKCRSWTPTRTINAPPEAAWSVEVDMARLKGATSDWIDLQDDFGLYFCVIRTDSLLYTSDQYRFPTDSPAIGDPDATLTLASTDYGHGLIPALQTTPNLGQGVRFMNGWQSVGRRQALSGSSVLTGIIEGPNGGTDNELVAFLQNNSADDAYSVNAEIRFWNYGMGGPDFELWAKGFGVTYNAPITVPAGANNVTLFATWLAAAVPHAYDPPHQHQCMWVQLSSSSAVNFAESSVRRNMDFDHMSDIERDAEISGEGYPEPADGSGTHDFLLRTFCRAIPVQTMLDAPKGTVSEEAAALVDNMLEYATEAVVAQGQTDRPDTPAANQIQPEPQWVDSIVYLWITMGFRRTGTFITIKGKQYENLDPSPGAFGVSAYHEGVNDNFSFSFSGAGLVQYAPGSYGVKVPHGGRTTVRFKLAASRDGPKGDVSALPKGAWPASPGTVSDGCGALLKRFGIWGLIVAVLLLLLLLYWLFA